MHYQITVKLVFAEKVTEKTEKICVSPLWISTLTGHLN